MNRPPAWHFANAYDPRFTACFALRGGLFLTPHLSEVTCRKCRLYMRAPLPHRDKPVRKIHPGWPGRCEQVLAGEHGLELCGANPCKDHSR